jgi:hypothetical protein
MAPVCLIFTQERFGRVAVAATRDGYRVARRETLQPDENDAASLGGAPWIRTKYARLALREPRALEGDHAQLKCRRQKLDNEIGALQSKRPVTTRRQSASWLVLVVPCGEVRLVRVETLAENAVDPLLAFRRKLGVDDTRLEFHLDHLRKFDRYQRSKHTVLVDRLNRAHVTFLISITQSYSLTLRVAILFSLVYSAPFCGG